MSDEVRWRFSVDELAALGIEVPLEDDIEVSSAAGLRSLAARGLVAFGEDATPLAHPALAPIMRVLTDASRAAVLNRGEVGAAPAVSRVFSDTSSSVVVTDLEVSGTYELQLLASDLPDVVLSSPRLTTLKRDAGGVREASTLDELEAKVEVTGSAAVHVLDRGTDEEWEVVSLVWAETSDGPYVIERTDDADRASPVTNSELLDRLRTALSSASR